MARFVLLLGAVAQILSSASARKYEFELLEHLGNLSPYFDAPNLANLETDLPETCSVEQVMMMQRHGSRYPLGSELSPYITGLVAKLGNASAVLSSSKAQKNLPSDLQFLTKGYTTKLGTNDETAPGRAELFNHGVDWKLKYPQFFTPGTPVNLLAGNQDRVIESAQWFREGLMGRGANSSSTLALINEDSVTQSWITPMNTCPLWQYNYGNNLTVAWGNIYLPRITSRLNNIFSHALPSPGLTLTTADVHGALYACAYDYAAWRSSPWCGAFEDGEIEDFEYELDLLMQGAFGYGLPGKMGEVLGGLYVRTLVDRFTSSSNATQNMYLEFGHDTTIDMALTALGLAKDTAQTTRSPNPYTSPYSSSIPTAVLPANPRGGEPSSDRIWRTSYQVPFAARMVWEKFSCSSSSSGLKAGTKYVRLVLNNAPISLQPVCGFNGARNAFGACDIGSFVGSPAVKTATTTGAWGGAAWNATCGGV